MYCGVWECQNLVVDMSVWDAVLSLHVCTETVYSPTPVCSVAENPENVCVIGRACKVASLLHSCLV